EWPARRSRPSSVCSIWTGLWSVPPRDGVRAQPGDPLERSRGSDGRRGPTQRHSFTQRRGPAARLVGRAAGPCDRASAVVDGDDVGVLLEPGVDGLGLAALAVLVHDEVLEGAV